MRLDHLLSKELNLLVGLVCSRVLDTGFAHGWNVGCGFWMVEGALLGFEVAGFGL